MIFTNALPKQKKNKFDNKIKSNTTINNKLPIVKDKLANINDTNINIINVSDNTKKYNDETPALLNLNNDNNQITLSTKNESINMLYTSNTIDTNNTNTQITLFEINNNVSQNLHNIEYTEFEIIKPDIDVNIYLDTDIALQLDNNNTLNNVKPDIKKLNILDNNNITEFTPLYNLDNNENDNKLINITKSIDMPLTNKNDKNKLDNNITNQALFNINENTNISLHNIEYTEIIKESVPDVSIVLNTNISNQLEENIVINNIKEELKLHINEYTNTIKQIDYNKLNFIKNNVKLIVNVYQEEYYNSVKASGFGDFIRGSYFLIQFCNKYRINYNIDLLNHPLSNCLKNNKYKLQTNKNINYFNITPFSKNNFIPEILNDNILSSKRDIETEAYFIDYLYEQYSNSSILLIYIIAFPDNNINNTDKNIMRYILEPNSNIKQKVYYILNSISFTLKQFTVIHIRCGDNLLVNKETKLDLQIINNIFSNLDNLFNFNNNNNYLLLADNNYIKKIIINKYFTINNTINIKTVFNKITHLGEGVKLTNNSIENTMIEFYLMSLSNNIFSMSIYEHGSGFSKWCAETYNIPYICKFIK